MTKVTIENEFGKYTVEVDKDDMNLSELLDQLVLPALLSVGYHRSTLDKYINI